MVVVSKALSAQRWKRKRTPFWCLGQFLSYFLMPKDRRKNFWKERVLNLLQKRLLQPLDHGSLDAQSKIKEKYRGTTYGCIKK